MAIPTTPPDICICVAVAAVLLVNPVLLGLAFGRRCRVGTRRGFEHQRALSVPDWPATASRTESVHVPVVELAGEARRAPAARTQSWE